MVELGMVNLNSIDNVKKFVNVVSNTEKEVDLVSGRYVIDAKSIMGVFSLDLSKPIMVHVKKEDAEDVKALIKEFFI